MPNSCPASESAWRASMRIADRYRPILLKNCAQPTYCPSPSTNLTQKTVNKHNPTRYGEWPDRLLLRRPAVNLVAEFFNTIAQFTTLSGQTNLPVSCPLCIPVQDSCRSVRSEVTRSRLSTLHASRSMQARRTDETDRFTHLPCGCAAEIAHSERSSPSAAIGQLESRPHASVL